jgi:Mg/Co/Ni transporter MgtE
VARTDVPTCALDERLGNVRDRVRAAGWDACVAVNPQRVVLGLLRATELAAEPDLRIEDAMRPGPSTFRPFASVEEAARFMVEHDLENSPVTTSDGRLVGLLLRQDAARVASELRDTERAEAAPGSEP